MINIKRSPATYVQESPGACELPDVASGEHVVAHLLTSLRSRDWWIP